MINRKGGVKKKVGAGARSKEHSIKTEVSMNLAQSL